jgi:hypothetical protein
MGVDVPITHDICRVFDHKPDQPMHRLPSLPLWLWEGTCGSAGEHYITLEPRAIQVLMDWSNSLGQEASH